MSPLCRPYAKGDIWWKQYPSPAPLSEGIVSIDIRILPSSLIGGIKFTEGDQLKQLKSAVKSGPGDNNSLAAIPRNINVPP